MKKIFLTLGGMLVFGIASAQVNVQPAGTQQNMNGSSTSQIRTTTRQDETLTKQQPGTGTSDTFSNQAPSAAPAMGTMNATSTSSNANASNQVNATQTTTTTQSANSSNTQGNAGQCGMGSTTSTTTTTTGTRRTP